MIFAILTVCVVGQVAAGLLMIRNHRVGAYRVRVIRAISEANKAEIATGELELWERRYEAFDQISYPCMLFTFWRPLHRFYTAEQLLLPEVPK